jgi:Sortase domain
MTQANTQAGAAIARRPPAPAGRHALGSQHRLSPARSGRSLGRLARRRATRHPVAAAVALGGLLGCVIAAAGGVAAGQGGRAATPYGKTPLVAIPAGRTARLPTDTHPLVTAPPVALTIPAIGVQTRLIRLGRTPAGALQVPSTTSVAGWYTGSPRPGELGAAVIAGHVDSVSGPGIFFRLNLLRPRNLILVRRADHSLAAFRVVSVRVYAKSHFPTAAVYGPAPVAELHLLTCGGTFDAATGHYLSNVIVSAVAVRWRRRASSEPSAAKTETHGAAKTHGGAQRHRTAGPRAGRPPAP